MLHSYLALVLAATDRLGNINWYYAAPGANPASLLTRPLPGGYMLTIQSGNSWNPNISANGQFLRKIDLSGNIIRETNIGVLQQQLIAKGATDFGVCGTIPLPAAIGSACLSGMHHDAILLPNGNTIVSVATEKIFPPGTQGDTTGLNVDIMGDGFLVLDHNYQVLWYFDTFQHDGGAPQLDINRPAVLGEKCAPGQPGCETLFLAGTPGVTTQANDCCTRIPFTTIRQTETSFAPRGTRTGFTRSITITEPVPAISCGGWDWMATSCLATSTTIRTRGSRTSTMLKSIILPPANSPCLTTETRASPLRRSALAAGTAGACR